MNDIMIIQEHAKKRFENVVDINDHILTVIDNPIDNNKIIELAKQTHKLGKKILYSYYLQLDQQNQRDFID